MSILKLKAIETHYNGYRFRSRLEARWAVFFDTLGIEYRYEPEGFDLGGLWYLPDFFLPKQKCWVEIKPGTPTSEEREKAIRLCIASQQVVTIFAGDVWADIAGFGFATLTVEETAEAFTQNVLSDYPHKVHWLSTSECISCDDEGDFWGANFTRGYMWSNAYWAECKHCPSVGIYTAHCTPCEHDPYEYHANEDRLEEAYMTARQARFERGAK